MTDGVKGAGQPARSRRNPVSGSLEKRLSGYAIAAGAVVVSLSAGAPLVQADIIFTPDHTLLSGNQSEFIDFNRDTVPDFKLFTFAFNGSSAFADLVLSPGPVQEGQAVIFGGLDGLFAAALPAGATIGPGDRFVHLGGYHTRMLAFASSYGGVVQGPWGNARNEYLGLSFSISGQKYYGWIELSAVLSEGPKAASVKALVEGFAYQNTPNTPILAGDRGAGDVSSAPTPEPGTLGLLALGALGLGFWRRKKGVASSQV